MANTIVDLPAIETPPVVGYAAYFAEDNVSTFSSRLLIASVGGDGVATTTRALDPGFVLYLPFSVTGSTVVNCSALVPSLTTPYPGLAARVTYPAIWSVGGRAVAVFDSTVDFPDGGTVFIPVTNSLPARVDMNLGLSALRAAALATTTTSVIPTSSSSLVVTPTAAPNTTTSTPNASSMGTPGPTTNPRNDGSPYGPGALAGGIVGAFLAALLLCALLWFFCIRRRRSRRSASQQRFSDSSNDYALADMARNPEKSQAVVAASAVTRWQKHLPQEKDDGTITKLFKSIFEQAQMHMEGYYGSNTQDLSDASIATLRELSEDDLPLMLSQTQKQVLLLEGILLRFMIRRISGRSDVQDSFLPGDLSRIAKNNKWYMERESGQSGVATSGKKRGFSQALAQWRQLTGFLLPNHRDDQAYQKELRTKIEAAVQNIDSAYSPWEISGKSSDKRRESLRGILQQVSDAGILLFTQPSTFLFDWSTPAQSDSRTVAISPALLRENEGSAREDVLIKGSQGKL
ncbi:unnamed protein product [Cercospora beticola]|nr:unnamed protein product [Cercospora beticola]